MPRAHRIVIEGTESYETAPYRLIEQKASKVTESYPSFTVVINQTEIDPANRKLQGHVTERINRDTGTYQSKVTQPTPESRRGNRSNTY